jgi:hypothetical protein
MVRVSEGGQVEQGMVCTFAFHEMIKCPKYLITFFCGQLFLSFSGTENEMRCPPSISTFRRSASTNLDDRFETLVAVLANCENFPTDIHQYTQYRTHSCKKLTYANYTPPPPPATHTHTHASARAHAHTPNISLHSPVVKVTCHKLRWKHFVTCAIATTARDNVTGVCLLSQTSVCSVFRVWDCT